MPYKIQKRGDKHCVVKKDGSKSFGCHSTPEKAKRQMAALHANTDMALADPADLTLAILELDAVGMYLADVPSSVYPKLERKPGISNWVDKVGGLPDYIERIAKHIHYEHAKSISTAIAAAVNTVKRWCHGGTVSTTSGPEVSHVTAATQAKACKAVAEWDAKKSAAHASQDADADLLLALAESDEEGLALAASFTLKDHLELMRVAESTFDTDTPLDTEAYEVALAQERAARGLDAEGQGWYTSGNGNDPEGLNMAIFNWDPRLHPHNPLTGQFVDVLNNLEVGDRVDLPDNHRVIRTPNTPTGGKTFSVTSKYSTVATGTKVVGAEAAASAALNKSAMSTHSESLGGATSYGSHTDVPGVASRYPGDRQAGDAAIQQDIRNIQPGGTLHIPDPNPDGGEWVVERATEPGRKGEYRVTYPSGRGAVHDTVDEVLSDGLLFPDAPAPSAKGQDSPDTGALSEADVTAAFGEHLNAQPDQVHGNSDGSEYLYTTHDGVEYSAQDEGRDGWSVAMDDHGHTAVVFDDTLDGALAAASDGEWDHEQHDVGNVAEQFDSAKDDPKAIQNSLERLRPGDAVMVDDTAVTKHDDGSFGIDQKRDVLAEGVGSASEAISILKDEEILPDPANPLGHADYSTNDLIREVMDEHNSPDRRTAALDSLMESGDYNLEGENGDTLVDAAGNEVGKIPTFAADSRLESAPDGPYLHSTPGGHEVATNTYANRLAVAEYEGVDPADTEEVDRQEMEYGTHIEPLGSDVSGGTELPDVSKMSKHEKDWATQNLEEALARAVDRDSAFADQIRKRLKQLKGE